MRRVCIICLSLIFLQGSFALAGGEAVVISHGRTGSSGVAAEARSYTPQRGSHVVAPESSLDAVASANQGPVQVPLVGMVECGHDPRFAGGLTCALAPLPDFEISRPSPRKDRESPEEIAGRFMDRAIALAPKPRLRITPRRRGLAGLESYFFLEERPRTIRARANVGRLIVTAEARPVQYIWTFGDGSDEVTRHHGRRWTKKRPGNIDHIYEAKRRYRVGVEVLWRARWRIGGGPWRTLGYFSNFDTARYRVGELVPVLVQSS